MFKVTGSHYNERTCTQPELNNRSLSKIKVTDIHSLYKNV